MLQNDANGDRESETELDQDTAEGDEGDEGDDLDGFVVNDAEEEEEAGARFIYQTRNDFPV